MDINPEYRSHQSHRYDCAIAIPELESFAFCYWGVLGYLPEYVDLGKLPSEQTAEQRAHNQRNPIPVWFFIYENGLKQKSIYVCPTAGKEWDNINDCGAYIRRTYGGGVQRAFTTLPYGTKSNQ